MSKLLKTLFLNHLPHPPPEPPKKIAEATGRRAATRKNLAIMVDSVNTDAGLF